MGWSSSASTAARQLSGSCFPLRPVIISAKLVTRAKGIHVRAAGADTGELGLLRRRGGRDVRTPSVR